MSLVLRIPLALIWHGFVFLQHHLSIADVYVIEGLQLCVPVDIHISNFYYPVKPKIKQREGHSLRLKTIMQLLHKHDIPCIQYVCELMRFISQSC